MKEILKKLKAYRYENRKKANSMARPRKDNQSSDVYVIKYLDGITDGLSKAIDLIEEELREDPKGYAIVALNRSRVLCVDPPIIFTKDITKMRIFKSKAEAKEVAEEYKKLFNYYTDLEIIPVEEVRL